MSKHTAGPWKIVCDAQGPCMVMHPKKEGVAIASLSNAFSPMKGFHDPTDDTPSQCDGAYLETTYRSERVANCKLIASAPDILAERDRLLVQSAELMKENERLRAALTSAAGSLQLVYAYGAAAHARAALAKVSK